MYTNCMLKIYAETYTKTCNIPTNCMLPHPNLWLEFFQCLLAISMKNVGHDWSEI
jgi:hypothetical protein